MIYKAYKAFIFIDEYKYIHTPTLHYALLQAERLEMEAKCYSKFQKYSVYNEWSQCPKENCLQNSVLILQFSHP